MAESTFAKGTKVAIGDTEAQIKALLRKHGAESIAIGESPGTATVAFHLEGRALIFRLPLPSRADPVFATAMYGARGRQPRPQPGIDAAWMQACRERWRGLLLCIKGKLESVEAEIETFDESFLANIVMPDGKTVGEHVIKPMQEQLAGSPPRPLLMMGG